MDIRKKWLRLIFTRVGVSLAIFIALVTYSLTTSAIPTDTLSSRAFIGSSSLFLIIGSSSLFLIIGSMLMVYICYRCAYKKPGTGLLTFCLVTYFIALPFATLPAIVKTIVVLFALSKLPAISSALYIASLLALIAYILDGFWIYYSIQLRKHNRRLQIDAVSDNPAYQLAIESLHNATSKEQLDDAYGEGVRQFPSLAWHFKKKSKSLRTTFKNGG